MTCLRTPRGADREQQPRAGVAVIMIGTRPRDRRNLSLDGNLTQSSVRLPITREGEKPCDHPTRSCQEDAGPAGEVVVTRSGTGTEPNRR